MTTTLQDLWKEWGTTHLTIEQVRQKYFPHLRTEKALRALIRNGKVGLKTHKLTDSRLEKPVVRLLDLADFLDARANEAA